MEKFLHLVSIIIPTCNSEKTILRCLDSVFKQTYQNFEVVICDDKSTDSTREVLKTVTDPRVSIYYLNENSGAAVARNTAMQNAKGELFAFLDSDDEWYPEKLETQIPYFVDKNVGLVLTGARIIKNEIKTVFYKTKKDWEVDSYRKLFMGEINYLTPTVIIRSDCVKKIGYMEPELRRNQDFDFFLRILKYYNLKVIETPLATIHMKTSKPTFTRLENSIKFYETKRIKFFREDFSDKEINLFFARKNRDLCAAILRSGKYSKCFKPFKKSLNFSPTFILNPSNLYLLFKSLVAGIINK